MPKGEVKNVKNAENKKENKVNKKEDKVVEDVEVECGPYECEVKKLDKLMAERKKLDVEIKKQMKEINKVHKQVLRSETSKKSKKNKKTTPTGFIKETPVENAAFAKYLGVEKGTMMSGPAITKRLHEIFNNKQMKDEKDKRIIYPDKETRKVFLLDEGENLNFNTLQSYIKQARLGEKVVKNKKEDAEDKEIKNNKESKKKIAKK